MHVQSEVPLPHWSAKANIMLSWNENPPERDEPESRADERDCMRIYRSNYQKGRLFANCAAGVSN
jgi:hypothetical protein